MEPSTGAGDHRERGLRYVLTWQGPPGEARDRKVEAIGQAALIVVRDYGSVPGWVGDLRAEVEEGRL